MRRVGVIEHSKTGLALHIVLNQIADVLVVFFQKGNKGIHFGLHILRQQFVIQPSFFRHLLLQREQAREKGGDLHCTNNAVQRGSPQFIIRDSPKRFPQTAIFLWVKLLHVLLKLVDHFVCDG